jgi:hypothetical protein
LIPKTSTKFALILASALCVVVAGVAYRPGETQRDPALKRSLAIGAIPVVLVIMLVLAPRMNLADLSVGAYDVLVRMLANTREGVTNQPAQPGQLLMYEEGTDGDCFRSSRRRNDLDGHQRPDECV